MVAAKFVCSSLSYVTTILLFYYCYLCPPSIFIHWMLCKIWLTHANGDFQCKGNFNVYHTRRLQSSNWKYRYTFPCSLQEFAISAQTLSQMELVAYAPSAINPNHWSWVMISKDYWSECVTTLPTVQHHFIIYISS